MTEAGLHDASREPVRERADLLLVRVGLFESRAKAQEAISAGLVMVDGRPLARASTILSSDADIAAEAPYPWVSRGGVKLAHALHAFGINPAGLTCLDVGASTGGFTDVLLTRGAAQVTAVDVGRGQLHSRIASDPRVTSYEATDIRRLDTPCAFDLVTVDVSFISLRLVLPELMRHLKERAQLAALIKPQFEVGRAHVGRGGIVRDAAAREQATDGIASFARSLGFAVAGLVPSPVLGADGNAETLLGARLG